MCSEQYIQNVRENSVAKSTNKITKKHNEECTRKLIVVILFYFFAELFSHVQTLQYTVQVTGGTLIFQPIVLFSIKSKQIIVFRYISIYQDR